MTMTVYSKQGLLYALLNEMYAGFPDTSLVDSEQPNSIFFFLSLGISDSISDLFKKCAELDIVIQFLLDTSPLAAF